MSTYRKEWDCCGQVTETEAYEPESCPFCTEEKYVIELRSERDRLHAMNSRLIEAMREISSMHGFWNNGIWVANKARAAIAEIQQMQADQNARRAA